MENVNPNDAVLKQNSDDSEQKQPSAESIEKIKYIMNSLNKNNILLKANELKTLFHLTPSLIKVFGSYLVMNRLSGEVNNHPMYAELIAQVDDKGLYTLLTQETLAFIKRLLESEKLLIDQNEKNMVKNLGSWLGIITLARNRPILTKDLDLKELIQEAYLKGRLSVIIPFVCRILRHSVNTTVYHQKNPWIQAICGLLLELKNLEQLKIAIKFDIENLLNSLGLNERILNPSSLLASVDPENQNDFAKPKSIINNLKHIDVTFDEIYTLLSKEKINGYISGVASLLKSIAITNNLNIGLSENDLLKLSSKSLVEAINEIIFPIVERAINVSLITTKTIVTKDFAFDPDGKKFSKASNNCMMSLSGSLAMVTSKEPLRNIFTNNLAESINKYLPEELKLTSENLGIIDSTRVIDLGCSYIQNTLLVRAIEKLENDKDFLEEIEKRKRLNTVQPSNNLNAIFNMLPDILKPEATGLTLEQYSIYDHFKEIYDSFRVNFTRKMNLLESIEPLIREFLSILVKNPIKAISQFDLCLKTIGSVVDSLDIEYYDNDDNIKAVSTLFGQVKFENEKIVSELLGISFDYAANSAKLKNLTLINIYTEILKGLSLMVSNSLSLKFSKECAVRLLTEVTPRLDLHTYMIKKSIIDLREYEKVAFALLSDKDRFNGEELKKILAGLIEKNVLSVKDLSVIPPYMIDYNSKTYFDLFTSKSFIDSSKLKLDLTSPSVLNIRDKESYIGFKNMSIFTYSQIVLLYRYTSGILDNDNENLKQYIKSFNETSISQNESQLNAFITVITEFSVQECQQVPDRLAYDKIDNLGRFIVILLNYISNPNKLKVFENILFGIFKILHLDYKKNEGNFNQKPYYRLFVSIIYLIYNSNDSNQLFSSNKKIFYFYVLADYFRTLRPLNYPGFAVAWLDLISYKYFSSILLSEVSSNRDTYMKKIEKYLNLVTDLISFFNIYKNESTKPQVQGKQGAISNTIIAISEYQKLVFKFLVLFTESYPEVVSNFYYIILYSLPIDEFIQLRSIILSAIPKELDPKEESFDVYSQKFNIESVPGIKSQTPMFFDLSVVAPNPDVKAMIDQYISQKNEGIIEHIIQVLNKKDNPSNSQIINWIVLYLFDVAFNKNLLQKVNIVESIIIFMMKSFELKNRDSLIHSILNELRYPCYQTLYFNRVLIRIFNEIENFSIEEHIYRNVVERLMYKPHPWGLLVAYFEINKSPKCKKIMAMYSEDEMKAVKKVIEEVAGYINDQGNRKRYNNFLY